MIVTLAVLLGHPHPFLRGFVGLVLLVALLMLIAAAAYARYHRHDELSSRLKTLEEKLDRFTPPAPPAAK